MSTDSASAKRYGGGGSRGGSRSSSSSSHYKPSHSGKHYTVITVTTILVKFIIRR